MSKLIKFLKPYGGIIALIFAILMVQAYCELSLPTYTSDIVNIGVQQHGITEVIPHEITEDDLDTLLLFVPNDDKATVTEAYEKNSENILELKDSIKDSDTKSDEIADILETPMFIGVIMNNEDFMEQMGGDTSNTSPEMDLSDPQVLQAAVESGALQESIDKALEGMPDTIISQATFAYIEMAYDNAGVDVESIQVDYMIKVGAKMLGLAGLSMLAAIIVGFLASRTGSGVGRTLRGKVFKKVVGFSNSEFDDFSTASLITRSTNDIQQIQFILIMMLRMCLYAPIMAAGGIWKVFQTNVDMVWLIGVGVAAVSCVVVILFVVVMPKFKIVQKLLDKINLVSREILSGLQVIRAFGTQKHEEERFDNANKDYMKLNLFVNRAMNFMMPAMMLIMNCLTVLIVWIGSHGVDAGNMQVGDMMAFIQYAMQIIMSFLMLTMISVMLPRAAVAAGRVDEVLVSKTMIKDPENAEATNKDEKGLVEFDNVSFKYPGAEENVIEDISFTANPGETTAIIGSTGSGKSTLINLIPRFYDVTGGSILVDGHDVRKITQHDLREKIGYVPQKGVLFSGDIKSNILYSNPDDTDATMERAAAVAQATDFIEAKDDKYDSPIAQGGTNVSGGQKQRLSIARAVAKDPQVYIFDDSFSALDFKTDLSLRKALREKTKDATVIIVAQRISTILNAEKILVLDEGKIVGQGTHKELLKNCDEYYQIASSQLSDKELAEDIKEVG
ncbi:MAG: ABC transporter ATP-binding protein [Suipraeoptans sp.]